MNGAPEEYVGITIMHELVHALQDQYVNLDSLEHIDGRRRPRGRRAGGDRRTGDVRADLHHGGRQRATSPRSCPAAGNRCAQTIREAQATQPIFASAPMVIQETLLFPYINGADFVRRFKARDTGKLARSTDLPVSTEQLMHDSAYFGSRRTCRATSTLPAIRRHGRREQLRRVRHAAVRLRAHEGSGSRRSARRTDGTAIATRW